MHLIPAILLISVATVGARLAVDELLTTFTGLDIDWYFKDKTWAKPIISCVTCMASVWGTVGHFYLGGDFATWPVTVLCCAYLNTYLYNKI